MYFDDILYEFNNRKFYNLGKKIKNQKLVKRKRLMDRLFEQNLCQNRLYDEKRLCGEGMIMLSKVVI